MMRHRRLVQTSTSTPILSIQPPNDRAVNYEDETRRGKNCTHTHREIDRDNK